jgi:hypothetical protein
LLDRLSNPLVSAGIEPGGNQARLIKGLPQLPRTDELTLSVLAAVEMVANKVFGSR